MNHSQFNQYKCLPNPGRNPFYPPHPPCGGCCCCVPGRPGASAYEIAVRNGFVGTEADWLESLKAPAAPFLSSYLEAVGSEQIVAIGGDFVFDVTAENLNVVGTALSIDSTGTVITIHQPGLYHLEWSMNLARAARPVVVGLLENGAPSSGITNSATSGNFSSGALILVEEGETPYTISLHNFGGALSLTGTTEEDNTSLSIRIARFADGASV